MAIVRYTPYGDLRQLEDRVQRLFGEFFPAAGRSEDIVGGAWVPAVDIYETKNEVVLKADLPEIESKDVTIKVEDNVLTINGERRRDKEIKEENYHRVERSYGTFTRSFTLPNTVNREKISAAFKDGVLRVTLPKREETKPREVKIDIG